MLDPRIQACLHGRIDVATLVKTRIGVKPRIRVISSQGETKFNLKKPYTVYTIVYLY